MENQNSKLSKKVSQSLGNLTEKQTAFAKVLINYNQLTPYPYSDLQISDWAKSIDDLMPQIKPETLKTIIDKMKMGVYEFDSKLGIQNIFSGARAFIRDEISELELSVEKIRAKNMPFSEQILTSDDITTLEIVDEKIAKLQNNLRLISTKPVKQTMVY